MSEYAQRNSWRPQLGDLVHDAQGNRVGVVIALPGDHGPDALTYHLTCPGGGDEWSAPGDGSTLTKALLDPVSVRAADVKPGTILRDRGRFRTVKDVTARTRGNPPQTSLVFVFDDGSSDTLGVNLHTDPVLTAWVLP